MPKITSNIVDLNNKNGPAMLRNIEIDPLLRKRN
jgi:hypothetical protein